MRPALNSLVTCFPGCIYPPFGPSGLGLFRTRAFGLWVWGAPAHAGGFCSLDTRHFRLETPPKLALFRILGSRSPVQGIGPRFAIRRIGFVLRTRVGRIGFVSHVRPAFVPGGLPRKGASSGPDALFTIRYSLVNCDFSSIVRCLSYSYPDGPSSGILARGQRPWTRHGPGQTPTESERPEMPGRREGSMCPLRIAAPGRGSPLPDGHTGTFRTGNTGPGRRRRHGTQDGTADRGRTSRESSQMVGGLCKRPQFFEAKQGFANRCKCLQIKDLDRVGFEPT